MLKFGTLSLLSLMPLAVLAFDIPVNCSLTETFKTDTRQYDQALPIGLSNNLRRKPGSPAIAEGRRITVVGRVLDEGCVPVAGATVEMWQTNAQGVYQSSEKSGKNVLDDKNFNGSGKMVTDNLGEFSFITIYPGHYSNMAPHLRFRIAHPTLGVNYTRMYFPGDSRNNSDPQLSKLSEPKSAVLIGKLEPAKIVTDTIDNQEEEIYTFEITVKGKQKKRKY